MSYKKDQYHIAKLIYKAVSDTLTQDEEREFGEWLKAGDNQSLYNSIVSSEQVENKRLIYQKLNKDTSFSRLESKIETAYHKKPQSRNLYNIYKYAAAVVILAVAGYMLFTETSFRNNSTEVVSTINPGYEKATLILADGSEIDLEKNKNQLIHSSGGVKIENRDNVLTYQSNESIEELNEVAFNTLHVPAGGIYTLKLPDGTKVTVNSASSLKYPQTFAKDKRIVELEGEAYFDVVKDKKQFIVKTKLQDVTVLGTSFNVSSYDDDDYFATTLVEGKVKLSGDIYLKPGQRAYMRTGESITVNSVDTRPYTAWKDGQFYFESESLDYILTKMGRWYNFETTFSDKTLKDETFTGVVLRDYPVEHLLSLISQSSNITYEITRNKSNQKYEVKISKE